MNIYILSLQYILLLEEYDETRILNYTGLLLAPVGDIWKHRRRQVEKNKKWNVRLITSGKASADLIKPSLFPEEKNK